MTLFAGPKDAPLSAGNRRNVDYRWNLAPLDLQPGMKVTFFAAAEDYLGQSGRSEPRRLIVVSAEELLARLSERVKLIAAELGRAVEMQRGCRDRAEDLQSSLAGSQPLRRSELDRLQAAEQAQREVELLLSGGGEGLPRQVRALLADVENNRVENPLLRRRMESLLAELQRLERERLPVIGGALTAAVKSARLALEGQGGQRQIADSIAVAVDNQNAVIAALEPWVARLTNSDGYGGFLLKLGTLLLDQQDAARRTAEVGRRTLARHLRDLSAGDAAELAAAGAAQLELAQRTDRLLQELAQSLGQLRRQDPASADAAGAVLDEARRRDIAAAMHDAADRIRLNQVGLAAAEQKRTVRDLQQTLGIAAGDSGANDSTGKSIGEAKDNQHLSPKETHAADHQPGTQPGTAAAQNPADRQAELERTRARMLRLWGELPPQVREHLTQSPGEDFPPKYERMIEDYFRRLAEGAGREERGEGGSSD